MSAVRRIAKNTTVLFIAQVASYLLAFFYIVYTARYLGATGFGILSFALAFTGIFVIVGDLGLQSLTVREVARNKSLASKYLANISLMKIILAIITFGLIALTINLMGYPGETVKVVYLVGLSVIFMAFSQMFFAIFQAFERMEFQAIGQVLYSALILTGVILAIKYNFSVVGFAFLFFIASVFVLVYSVTVMKLKFSNPSSEGPRAIEYDWSFWKSTIRQAFPFFLLATFSIIAFRIDAVMLSMMKGDAVVGWYSAAHKLIEALMFIPVTLVASMYPVLSNLYISSREFLELAYQKTFKYLLILGVPIAVGTTILADRIIMLVYHSGFTQSIIILQVLIWATPIMFLNHMFGTVFASINKQWLSMRICLIGTVLNVVINLILIPRYSYIGAAIATIAAGLVGLILSLYFLSRLVSKIRIHKLIVQPLVASALMAAFVIFSPGLNLFLLIFVAAMIYFGALIVLKTFSREDLELFRQVISSKPETK